MIDTRSCKLVEARKWPKFAVVLAAALSLGACSQNLGGDFLSMAPDDHSQNAPSTDNPVQRLAYYSKLFADHPKDKEIALAYAKALSDGGHKSKSLAILRTASAHHPKVREFSSACCPRHIIWNN